MSNAGFRIYSRINRPDPKLVEQFSGLPVANIADNMNRLFCVDSSIRPMNKCALLGPAVTVKSRPGDNLMFHKALDMAKPGDVIVVDLRGETVNSAVGEIMMRYAMKKEIAGFLIDGAVRDTGALVDMEFSVFAKGITPMGPYKDGPGEINVQVCCGGVCVNPGDIVVGDADGVVIIPQADAAAVLEKAKATFAKEAGIFKAIEEGTWDRAWIDKTLKEKGCEFIDD